MRIESSVLPWRQDFQERQRGRELVLDFDHFQALRLQLLRSPKRCLWRKSLIGPIFLGLRLEMLQVVERNLMAR